MCTMFLQLVPETYTAEIFFGLDGPGHVFGFFRYFHIALPQSPANKHLSEHIFHILFGINIKNYTGSPHLFSRVLNPLKKIGRSFITRYKVILEMMLEK